MAKPTRKKIVLWSVWGACGIAALLASSVYLDYTSREEALKRYEYSTLAAKDILADWQCLTKEQEKISYVKSLIERFSPQDVEELRIGTLWVNDYVNKQQKGLLTVADREAVKHSYGAVQFNNGTFLKPLPWRDGVYSATISVRSCIEPSGEVFYDPLLQQHVSADFRCINSGGTIQGSGLDGGINISYVSSYLNWQMSSQHVNVALSRVEYNALLVDDKLDAKLEELQAAEYNRLSLRQRAKENVSSMPANAVPAKDIAAYTEKEYLRLACQ